MACSIRTSPLLVAALAALALLLVPPAPASAARDLEVSIMDDQLLLGASQQNIDASMTIFRALGVDRLRVSAFWEQIAPRARSTRKPSRFDAANHQDPRYNWSQLDPVVLSAVRSGLRVMISISTPGPVWASEDPRRRSGVWKPKPAEYAAFSMAVAARYGAVVDQFGILNEPNQGAWLQPQSDSRGLASPHLYRALVQAAYPAVKAAAPQSVALIGELAPSGRGADDRGATRPIRPLEFLRAMGCVNRRFRAVRSGRCRGFSAVPGDALGHHPYSLLSPPRARSRNRDDAAIGDWRRLLQTIDRLTARRRVRPSSGRRLDVYYTEYGYQTNPPDFIAGVRLSQQNRWLQDAAYLAWSTPRVRGINQFRLTDGAIDGNGRDALGEFQSGLLFRSNRPKPSFSSFPNPFVASTTRPRRGSRISLWGQARPGDGRHDVTIEFRSGRSGSFRSLTRTRTDARGYFRRRVRARSGQYRFRYSGGGASGTSQVVSIRTR